MPFLLDNNLFDLSSLSVKQINKRLKSKLSLWKKSIDYFK